MNERIFELARQVWPDPNISHVNHMKFAELIVQECMNVIYNIDDLGGYHFKAANAVKEHFGVEE